MDDAVAAQTVARGTRVRRSVWFVLAGFILVVFLVGGWPRFGIAVDAGTGRTAADLVFKTAAPRLGDKVVFDTECNSGPDVLDRIEAAAGADPNLRIADSDVRGEAEVCAMGQSRVDVLFADGSAIRLQGTVDEWCDLTVAAASVIR